MNEQEAEEVAAQSSNLGLECENACRWDGQGHMLLLVNAHHCLVVDGRDLERHGLLEGPLVCVDRDGCRWCRRRLAAHMAYDSVPRGQLSHSFEIRESDHMDVHVRATSAGMVCWRFPLRLSFLRLLDRSNSMPAYRGSKGTMGAKAYWRMVM